MYCHAVVIPERVNTFSSVFHRKCSVYGMLLSDVVFWHLVGMDTGRKQHLISKHLYNCMCNAFYIYVHYIVFVIYF